MFQFPGLPPLALFDSGKGTRALPRAGFPIRKSRDHRLVSTYPGLIAAAHVLHRLLAPRHPPCALVLLIRKNTCVAAMEFSRCAGRRPLSKRENPPQATVSQNSTAHVQYPCRRTSPASAYLSRGRRCFQASSLTGRPKPSNGAGACRSKSSGIPRKEVIQPQLPLRLPCYDFTPIIDPTFDGCLPCGLAHRLRVLPTFVV